VPEHTRHGRPLGPGTVRPPAVLGQSAGRAAVLPSGIRGRQASGLPYAQVTSEG
jgi:hypothetical protein